MAEADDLVVVLVDEPDPDPVVVLVTPSSLGDVAVVAVEGAPVANGLDFFSGDGPAGTGTINVGVYVGSTPTNLARVATAVQSGAAANTLYDLALSAAVSWTAGQYVSVVILMLGFTTSPVIRCIGGGGPGSALLNPTSTRMAGTAASQTSLPASINLQSGWSGSGLPLWWALAD